MSTDDDDDDDTNNNNDYKTAIGQRVPSTTAKQSPPAPCWKMKCS